MTMGRTNRSKKEKTMITDDIIGLVAASHKTDKKGDNTYSVTFHSKDFTCRATDEQFEAYLQAAADIYKELSRMLANGGMKRKDFGRGEATPDEERERLAQQAFAAGGILDTPGIRGGVKKIAEVTGRDPDSLFWVLLYRPYIHSVIYSTAEGIACREPGWDRTAKEIHGMSMDDKDWELYFTDYLFRGILFTMNMGHWGAENKEEKE